MFSKPDDPNVPYLNLGMVERAGREATEEQYTDPTLRGETRQCQLREANSQSLLKAREILARKLTNVTVQCAFTDFTN